MVVATMASKRAAYLKDSGSRRQEFSSDSVWKEAREVMCKGKNNSWASGVADIWCLDEKKSTTLRIDVNSRLEDPALGLAG